MKKVGGEGGLLGYAFGELVLGKLDWANLHWARKIVDPIKTNIIIESVVFYYSRVPD